jgi:hypothetical protein
MTPWFVNSPVVLQFNLHFVPIEFHIFFDVLDDLLYSLSCPSFIGVVANRNGLEIEVGVAIFKINVGELLYVYLRTNRTPTPESYGYRRPLSVRKVK